MSDTQNFDFSVNLLRALLWEYDAATNLQALIQNESNWYALNHSNFWSNWITDVFDLRTANQFGLTVWGYILGIKLYVNTPPPVSIPAFGFDDAGFGNFDNSNFQNPNGITYVLPPDIQRIALQLRYAQLTSSGTVPEINRIIKKIFAAYGQVFLSDYQNMHQQYVFLFPVSADLIYLFNNYDILPRPASVNSSYIDGTRTYFGFDDAMHANFDNGNFGS